MTTEHLKFFLQSREALQVTEGTLEFYRKKLNKFFKSVDPEKAQRSDIEHFLLGFKNPGNRHCYFRALKTFFSWREEVYGVPSPMLKMKAPILPKRILPTLTREEVVELIDASVSPRDKAIIALFTESGLRLSELANIREDDIDWNKRIIKVSVKGQRESYAIYGDETDYYLNAWVKIFQPKGGYIWDLNAWGISSMLKRLSVKTGMPCNAHVFRRTFACILRQNGASTLTIKELGRWETTQMVEHYTRAIGFHESIKFYKSPLAARTH